MGIAVKIPDKMAEYIKAPYNKTVSEMLVVELYREGAFTLRQAAEMLGMNVADMFDVLKKRKTYLNYGDKELNEDISYARS
ncbi:MAG: UPF0175 family protein [Thermodesulfovibrionales bacterium]|nr:UPF0175 family protein [Thermodesulfovibrionales bacterium]